ncbi:MAG: hypothetical protein KDD47_07965, partial [Acidobacteria bacterium]|nr:hypothetical protein [Acidobacteriota bacterium]
MSRGLLGRPSEDVRRDLPDPGAEPTGGGRPHPGRALRDGAFGPETEGGADGHMGGRGGERAPPLDALSSRWGA